MSFSLSAFLPLLALLGCLHIKPDFVEIRPEQIKDWRPVPNGRQYEGAGWQLKLLFENTTPFANHLVWMHDGRVFDLKHFNEKRGIEGYNAWGYEVVGSKLYLYSSGSKSPLPGGTHSGWFHSRTMIPSYAVGRISTPDGATPPATPVKGGLYQWDGNRLSLVAGPSNYDVWLKQHTGDYFIPGPGEGVVNSFELAPQPK